MDSKTAVLLVRSLLARRRPMPPVSDQYLGSISPEEREALAWSVSAISGPETPALDVPPEFDCPQSETPPQKAVAATVPQSIEVKLDDTCLSRKNVRPKLHSVPRLRDGKIEGVRGVNG